MDRDKFVDESWKDSIEKQKDELDHAGDQPEEGDAPALDFINYVASLAYQAMIFMGEAPNPVTSQVEKNLRQAKFLIDTLIMLRDKTKGNLSKQEDELLNGSVYELQMKFIEILKKEGPVIQ